MDERIQVVAVCENQARIYSSVKDGRRFIRAITFGNRGQAVQFAVDYEAKQRNRVQSEPQQ